MLLSSCTLVPMYSKRSTALIHLMLYCKYCSIILWWSYFSIKMSNVSHTIYGILCQSPFYTCSVHFMSQNKIIPSQNYYNPTRTLLRWIKLSSTYSWNRVNGPRHPLFPCVANSAQCRLGDMKDKESLSHKPEDAKMIHCYLIESRIWHLYGHFIHT